MKLVFDTNVLISAFLFSKFSASIFDFCVLNHEIYISNWILDEFEEKISTKKFRLEPNEVQEVCAEIRLVSKIVNPTNPIPTVCRDIDDNNVLQLAEFVNAHYLITGDKDLLDLTSFKHTEIVTPRYFFNQYLA